MKCINRKPTIVFDLDETLVHITPIAPINLHNNNYFTIKIKRNKYYVQTRPYLQTFLEKVSKLYNICTFTASEQIYADKIIDKILQNVNKSSRFYKDSCICMGGYLVKNLNIIHCPLNQILIVDDCVGSALMNPKNLIRIKPWYGENDDKVLQYLIPILENISFDDDLPASFKKFVTNCNYKGIGTFYEPYI